MEKSKDVRIDGVSLVRESLVKMTEEQFVNEFNTGDNKANVWPGVHNRVEFLKDAYAELTGKPREVAPPAEAEKETTKKK